MPKHDKNAVLVINSGSSSVKFTLFGINDRVALAKGLVERIGSDQSRISYRNRRDETHNRAVEVHNVKDALPLIIDCLIHPEYGILNNIKAVAAIGHRVVHGGEKIHSSVIIDANVEHIIAEYSLLAPLHNPPNLEGIEACQTYFPGTPQVAVFDTAFHAALPEHAYLYGLPYQFYTQDKIRRYGFHGTSHRYVSNQAASLLQRPLEELKLITCHLGNGSSITAVDGGQSVDTSMGFTPLEGLVMGTRCGSIDPAIVTHLMTHKQMDASRINELLNKESGYLGMAGLESGDLRNVISAMQQGDPRASAAIRVFVHQIRKYIGAYFAVMNGLDAIVFTGGIGQNSALIRELVCDSKPGLTQLGIYLDKEKNNNVEQTASAIQDSQSSVALLVIPTDEEKEIAQQTITLLGL